MSEFVRITDPDDVRVAPYRSIRERDLVGRHGRFVAEGKVVLRALLASTGYAVDSILLLENRVGGLREELANVPSRTPVYVTSRNVIDQIAGYAMHRGILAIGLKPDEVHPETLLVKADRQCVVILCVGIANHDNVGSIFRNAATFGADAILLDKTCCDPLYRKALRVSVGAVLKVPFYRGGNSDQLLELLAKWGVDIYAMSPAGTVKLEELAPSRRSAIVFGSEGAGLPARILDQTIPVRIIMKPGFDSLNVAAASAIAMHHFRCASVQ